MDNFDLYTSMVSGGSLQDKKNDVSLYCGDIIGTTIVYETTATQQVTYRFTLSFSINCRLNPPVCPQVANCIDSITTTIQAIPVTQIHY